MESGHRNGLHVRRIPPAVGHFGTDLPLTALGAFVDPDDRKRIGSLQAKADEHALDYTEYRITRPDNGQVRWIARRGEMLRDENGQLSRGVGVAYDITDRKLAEDALRESEAKFRTFSQAMPNHVWTAARDGELEWFNEKVYEYSGAREGELDGARWAQILHPDDAGGAVRSWVNSVKTGEVYQTEFRLRRSDGAFRWHLARALPIRDASGTIVRWIGTNTDIEDQKAAAAELARLNATLEEHGCPAHAGARQTLARQPRGDRRQQSRGYLPERESGFRDERSAGRSRRPPPARSCRWSIRTTSPQPGRIRSSNTRQGNDAFRVPIQA